MRLALQGVSAICLCGALLLAGCERGGGDVSEERLKSMAGGQLKEVVPVKGKVFVDGEPAGGVNIYAYPEGGGQPVNNCRSNPDGSYCWSTHLACDGIEPGTYLLAFEYMPEQKRNDEGVDLLKGKYRNPTRNNIKLTVQKGAPQENVNYELVTK